ncbi:prepilin-type N-terminal cleavage/methylation domain-containing protein, partial [bacterium]|nr:prepilin-type N-terminal cleavage/methylation domain-containing protein [bacterium]
MRMFKGKEKGFTLIEMMIVIVIIGVMTVVVGIKYRDYKDKLT